MSAGLFLAAAVALAACEAVGRRSDRGWPTVAQLVGDLRARLVGRIVLGVVWLWLGWHTFAR